MVIWYGSDWPFWQSAVAWLAILLFWVLVVRVVYVFAISGRPRTLSRDDSADARHILDRRLARGEIDAAEYRRLRDLIDSDRHHATRHGTWPSDKAGSSRR